MCIQCYSCSLSLLSFHSYNRSLSFFTFHCHCCHLVIVDSIHLMQASAKVGSKYIGKIYHYIDSCIFMHILCICFAYSCIFCAYFLHISHTYVMAYFLHFSAYLMHIWGKIKVAIYGSSWKGTRRELTYLCDCTTNQMRTSTTYSLYTGIWDGFWVPAPWTWT